jgi:hypothetical protein
LCCPLYSPLKSDAINTQEHGLAIEDELLGSDTSGGLDDQRIAVRPVVAVAGVKPAAAPSRERISL